MSTSARASALASLRQILDGPADDAPAQDEAQAGAMGEGFGVRAFLICLTCERRERALAIRSSASGAGGLSGRGPASWHASPQQAAQPVL